MPAALPSVDDLPHEKIQNGVHYLLIDGQVKADSGVEPEYYYHNADYIVNQSGVESSSQINIGYHPEYQTVTLHTLRVVRDGKVIDKLDTARMNVFQREEELDDLIYNGRMTLNIILDDVRVGDIVEYSYSRNGMNPVYQNVFSYGHYLNWSVPVGRLALRLMWNKPGALQYQIDNSDVQLKQQKTAEGVEYVIRVDAVEPIKREDDTPTWFVPWGMIHFSEVSTWAEVVKWGLPLYATLENNNHENVDAVVKQIKTNHKDEKSRISAALRFVQDEIRYLGIELGQSTHRPTPASKTLQNRYGDCKDKTVLLIALLKGLGVEAYPVLVNTDDKLEDRLPGVRAFDHVITYLVHDGQGYWVDPTRQYQYGDIDSIHQPDFGMALVLRPGEDGLVKMSPRQSRYGVSVKDRFVLHADGTVDYSTVTTKHGWNAERVRQEFFDYGMDEMQSEYLEFFQAYYPGIVIDKPLSYTDDEKENVFITTEHYRVENFWRDKEESQRHIGDFYSNIVGTSVAIPDEPKRTQPLYLTHPEHIEQVIEVIFEDDGWYFENERFLEDNDIFHFKSNVKFDEAANRLTLSYIYDSKVETVGPGQYQGYVDALKRVDDHRGYSIYKSYADTTSVVEEEAWYVEYVTLRNFILLILSIYVLVFILWRVDRRRHPDSGDAVYYPVSMPKLIVMWLITFGIYGVYWFYRNYSYIKKRENNSSMPVARGIFNIFWYYPLWSKLKEDNDERFSEKHLPGKSLAIVLALLFFVSGIAGSNDDLALPALLLCVLLVLPLANYIFFVNDPNDPDLLKNSKWSFRHVLLMLISVPLLVLSVGSELAIIPSDRVEHGSWLLDRDIKVMQRRGIMRPDDHVKYFYSDALLYVGDDGNGFTQRHVFSYWKDEDGALQREMADYDEIKDIRVDWSNSYVDNTTVTIVRDDESEFILFVSGVDGRDRLFVNALKQSWKSLQ